jgi:hypothetical protein
MRGQKMHWDKTLHLQWHSPDSTKTAATQELEQMQIQLNFVVEFFYYIKIMRNPSRKRLNYLAKIGLMI